MSPLVVWLIVLALLAIVGTPLAAAALPRSPDRGVAFALPLSLVVLAAVTYWVGQVSFGTHTVVGAVVVLASLSALASRVAPTVPRRPALETAVVFGVSFAAMLALRLVDPAAIPQGGEKFLDYGLLQSMLRADRLPPEDVWFAGERLRYYYGGHLVAGILAKLSGVEARYAYNLALPTFFACIATGAYGLAGTIADARGRSPRGAGIAAAVVVAFGNNLAPVVRILLGYLPDSLVEQYGRAAVAGIRAPTQEALDGVIGSANWGYWNTRYVLDGTLVVSPSWEYVNGDLHAHMMAPPFLLLVGALCFAWYRAPASDPRRWLRLAATVPVVGLLALTNLWSVPTACGLVALTVACSDAHPLAGLRPHSLVRLATTPVAGVTTRSLGGIVAGSRLLRELTRHAVAGLAAVAVGLGGALTVAPFLLDHTPVSRGVGFLPPRSGLVPYLIAWGVFVVPFAVALLPQTRSWAGASRRRSVVLALALVVSLAAVAVDFAALAVLGPLLLAGWVVSRTRGDFAAVLVLAGAGLLLIVELAYARVWPVGGHVRWNTVYKVSMQVWVLWGVGLGVVFGRWHDRLHESLRAIGQGRDLPSTPSKTVLTSLLLVVVLGSTLAFPALVAQGQLEPAVSNPQAADLSLDATKFVEQWHANESGAIDWLNEREGTPTILTQAGDETYQWHSAPAALTGLPAVVGWEHEAGYRGVEAYEKRVNDTAAMYTGNWSESARLLAKYDVRYIYVGPDERARYDRPSISHPDRRLVDFAEKPGITVAHQSGTVTIYEVDETALCTPENGSCSNQARTPPVRTTK
ncbi:DUF2298 domain-containing protein [Haloarchaeobius sp. DT45]|uniref:DUF2298 domain-containing protein n=1 Tax=Haloarchaeobius sp. DT45 TaxID=3446116 RepID=UPI003F6CC026